MRAVIGSTFLWFAALNTAAWAEDFFDASIEVWLWTGDALPLGSSATEETSFFNQENWLLGSFGAPSVLPLSFGPSVLTTNNGATFIRHRTPRGIAVFDANGRSNTTFQTPRLTMDAWDGPSKLILKGGTLDTSGTIGDTSEVFSLTGVREYTPTGDLQPATIVLDGGTLAGTWNFIPYADAYQVGAVSSEFIIKQDADLSDFRLTGQPGRFIVEDGAQVDFGSGFAFSSVISNNGSLSLADQPSGTQEFRIGQSNAVIKEASFTGTGELFLRNSDDRILANGSTSNPASTILLTNGADHTIRGQGSISVAVENAGTIRAEGGDLVVSTLNSNTGVLEIASDATLAFSARSAANRNVQVDAGQIVYEDGAVLRSSDFSSAMINGDGTLTLRDSLSVSGTLTNNGSLTFEDRENRTQVLQIGQSNAVAKEASFVGAGELVLRNDDDRIVANGTVNRFTTTSLTNGADHTIRGQGSISVAVENAGTIRAEGGELVVGQLLSNTGGLEIASDGELTVQARTSNSQSYLDLGTVTFEDGATLGRSRFRDGQFVGEGTLNVESGLNIAGTISHSGTLQIVDEENSVETILIGPSNSTQRSATFAGAGELVLSSGGTNIVGNGTTNNRTPVSLTNGADHTIRGQGGIFVDLTNEGTIRAQGGELVVARNLAGDGKVEVAGTSTLDFRGSHFQANTLMIEEGGQFRTGNARLEVVNWLGDLDQTTGVYAPGASPAQSLLDGDYDFLGGLLELEFAGPNANEFDYLDVAGDFTLDGGGLLISLLEGFSFKDGLFFDVINVQGSRTGTFDGLLEGALVGTYGVDLFITYEAGNGNDIALYTAGGASPAPVPLPASLSMLLAGLIGTGCVFRRRSANRTL